MKYQKIDIDENCSILHLGPPKKAGPLPSVFYFALSAEDSLGLYPFNQPAIFLSSSHIRIFSMTLPGHENKLPPKEALSLWAKEIEKDSDIISAFTELAKKALQYTISEKLSDPGKIATIGLSRGAYIALHLAAKCKEIKWLLGFAPLIDLANASEFKDLQNSPLVQRLHGDTLIPSLLDKKIRFYIGNRDTRVGTKNSFSFIEKLSETAYLENNKKSLAELIISPSIGYKGHGTGWDTFNEGCKWLKDKLLAKEL